MYMIHLSLTRMVHHTSVVNIREAEECFLWVPNTLSTRSKLIKKLRYLRDWSIKYSMCNKAIARVYYYINSTYPNLE